VYNPQTMCDGIVVPCDNGIVTNGIVLPWVKLLAGVQSSNGLVVRWVKMA
jgi:hypothetical protein